MYVSSQMSKKYNQAQSIPLTATSINNKIVWWWEQGSQALFQPGSCLDWWPRVSQQPSYLSSFLDLKFWHFYFDRKIYLNMKDKYSVLAWITRDRISLAARSRYREIRLRMEYEWLKKVFLQNQIFHQI